MVKFDTANLAGLWKPKNDSFGEDNGQITIVGGSELFTGAPILSAIAASRLVDMVFLATPDEDRGIVEKVRLFSKLRSVIWVPREDLEAYIEKSSTVLIGPGMMRYTSENHKSQITNHKQSSNPKLQPQKFDRAGKETKKVTEDLLKKFPKKQWVIDGGSLQVMDKKWIPKGAILTPNRKEFQILFGKDIANFDSDDMAAVVEEKAREFECVIVYKAPVSVVSDGKTTYEVGGGNAGLTKGGTGDVLAGVIAGLAVRNRPLIAAAAASWVVKKTAEKLYELVGYNFNADDVADKVFEVLKEMTG